MLKGNVTIDICRMSGCTRGKRTWCPIVVTNSVVWWHSKGKNVDVSFAQWTTVDGLSWSHPDVDASMAQWTTVDGLSWSHPDVDASMGSMDYSWWTKMKPPGQSNWLLWLTSQAKLELNLQVVHSKLGESQQEAILTVRCSCIASILTLEHQLIVMWLCPLSPLGFAKLWPCNHHKWQYSVDTCSMDSPQPKVCLQHSH